jgi:hypothetical protein
MKATTEEGSYKMKATTEEALERIQGSVIGESMIYYDDSMQRYYVGPASDLDYLRDLMADDDEEVRSDAYSHWCAGTSHGDGYATLEEAAAAARYGARVVVRDGCNDRCGMVGMVAGYDAENAAIIVRFGDGEEQHYDYLALDSVNA